ncbi:hypothetical protein GC101_13940 [Paenibacillus sp. LMG 31459]|uniref:NADP-dependent oxidoreductase domain-containing protein n=1 Tax=Paenibacillus phytohabitans TaxID=2654978 RepID=A0ABX1YHX2_9BACL|nr:hypothetical protein [Paenibacillus phytohabitans]
MFKTTDETTSNTVCKINIEKRNKYEYVKLGHIGLDIAKRDQGVIMTEIYKSSKRLNTDYMDLYQIYRLDNTTPIVSGY